MAINLITNICGKTTKTDNDAEDDKENAKRRNVINNENDGIEEK